MNEKEFKSLIAEGGGGGFLFYGDEPYLKNNCLSKLRSTICDEAFAVFNHIKINAASYSPEALRDAIASPPMMSDRKLVELEELGISAMRTKELETLCSVLELLPKYDCTVLVLNADEDFDTGILPNKPSAQYKMLSNVLSPVAFEKATEAQLKNWIARHFKSVGVEIDASVAAELVAYCGRSMENLIGEIDKLSAYVLSHGANTVSTNDIKNVCSHNEESDAFALVNAVLAGRPNAAFEALADMKRRRVDPISVLGAISRVYADLLNVKTLSDKGMSAYDIAKTLKMHEYKAKLYCRNASAVKLDRIKKAIGFCLDADLELKNGNSGYLPIEKLLCRCSAKDV